MTGLASSAFARHYSRNHCCFLFLRVLRCFTSPRSLHAAYVFSCGSHRHSRAVRGFPIRKSWRQRPVIDSTRLIADSHVLLRLLMPRHPPCALENLTTNRPSKELSTNRENHTDNRTRKGPGHRGSQIKEIAICTGNTTKGVPRYKMLASTMQFPNNNPNTPTPHHQHPPKKGMPEPAGLGHARGQPRHTTEPPTTHPAQPCGTCAEGRGPVVSGPNSAPWTRPDTDPDHRFPTPPKGEAYSHGPGTRRNRPQSVDIPPMSTRRPTNAAATGKH